MKAAVVEERGRLVVRDVPDPEMGEYDALCEILYGATCTATDQHIIDDSMPLPVAYPTILGHESIGRVIAVGKRVRNFKVGDLVTRIRAMPCPAAGLQSHWGGFAELGIARDHWVMREEKLPLREWDRARRNQLLPPDFDPAASTMIITWRETLSYITRMAVTAGASVLVIGSGGNGLSFAAHARNLQASKVVLVGNAAREAVSRKVGAGDFFDYKTDDVMTAVADAQGKDFDFIIDAVGKDSVLDAALPLLKAGGMIAIYGIEDYGRCKLNPTRARGSFTYYGEYLDEEEAHEQTVSFVQQGKLDASLWLDLDNPFPLDDINAAFQVLKRRKLVKALIKLKQ